MIGIYRIYNKVTGLIYIGSSGKGINNRLRQHRHELNKGTHSNWNLLRHWKKYGPDSFIFEPIEILNPSATRIEILAREQFYIDQTNCCDPRFGYNIVKLAGSRLGTPHSPEVRAKHKARMNDPQVRARISDGRRANPPQLTEQDRQNIKDALYGNTHGLGYKHTEEAKSKISENNIGKHGSDIQCDNGHLRTTENTYIEANGDRDCRTCHANRSKAYLDRGNNREIHNRKQREKRLARKSLDTPSDMVYYN